MTDNDIARTFSYTSSVNVERINGWRRFGIFAVKVRRSTIDLLVNTEEIRASSFVSFHTSTRMDGFPDTAEPSKAHSHENLNKVRRRIISIIVYNSV